jgi:hypothetical protein
MPQECQRRGSGSVNLPHSPYQRRAIRLQIASSQGERSELRRPCPPASSPPVNSAIRSLNHLLNSRDPPGLYPPSSVPHPSLFNPEKYRLTRFNAGVPDRRVFRLLGWNAGVPDRRVFRLLGWNAGIILPIARCPDLPALPLCSSHFIPRLRSSAEGHNL